MVINTKNKVVSAETGYQVTQQIAEAMAPNRPKATIPKGAQPYTITPRESILGNITTPHGIPVKGK